MEKILGRARDHNKRHEEIALKLGKQISEATEAL